MIVTELERCNLRRRTIFEWKMHNNLQRKIKTEEMEHDEGEMKMLMKQVPKLRDRDGENELNDHRTLSRSKIQAFTYKDI